MPSGDKSGDPEVARFWITNRIRDCETRLHTQECVAESIANNTDARSTEGKKARKIFRTLHFLREELAELGQPA